MPEIKEIETKTRRVTPTLKQRMVVASLLGNVGSNRVKSQGAILKENGYGKISQDPKRILQSAGVRQALAEFGLTDELITCALVEDIAKKPQRRVAELTLGSDLLGMRSKAEENDKTPRVVIINEVRVNDNKPLVEPIEGSIV